MDDGISPVLYFHDRAEALRRAALSASAAEAHDLRGLADFLDMRARAAALAPIPGLGDLA